MLQLPPEIIAAIKELDAHYADFVANDRGGNGYLWFAKNRVSLAEVAIKFYAGEPGDRRHDEPRLLSTISAPNVLPIHEARTVSDDWAYFITPRCDGGDLDDFIAKQPSVYEAIDVALGVSTGLSAIHACGMVHRDLKLGNIVMDRGVPRIADFGSVRALASGQAETTASQHSVLYRPPESFATNRYSRLGDVYQVGLVTYQLLGGVMHYNGTRYLSARERKLYDATQDNVDRSLIVDGAIRRHAEAGSLADFNSLLPWITNSAKRVLRSMVNPSPSRRMSSIAEVASGLSQLRATLRNWRFDGANASLVAPVKSIELRPTAGPHYEAFQKKTGMMRRIPGWEPSTLTDLVTRCDRI
jgi:serine/threonine protein kinase